MTLNTITKKEALELFKTADTVTMREYFAIDPQTREDRAAIGGLIGRERKVTATKSNAVRLDESWLTIDSLTEVFRDDRGFIVVYSLDDKRQPLARMTYDVDPGE